MIERVETRLQCKHGQLRRQCEICERDAEIERLTAELDTIKRQASDATEFVLAGVNADLEMENRELRAERDALKDRLKIANQGFLEIAHAQECGPGWYTRGLNGMWQHVYMWVRRGLEATEPPQENGE